MILSQRRYKKKKLSVQSKASVLSSNSTHTSTESAVDTTTISEVRQKYSNEMLRSVGLNLTEDNELVDEEECCNWKNPREKKKSHKKDKREDFVSGPDMNPNPSGTLDCSDVF